MSFKLQVRAYDASANTADSAVVETNYPPVAAPIGTLSNLVATLGGPGSTTAVLTWDYETVTSDSLTGFELWVGDAPTPDWGAATFYADVVQASYELTLFDLNPGANYIYVRAMGDGVYSEPVSDSVEIEAIGYPLGLTAEVASAGLLDIAWNYSESAPDYVSEFWIYVGTSPTPTWATGPGSILTVLTLTDVPGSFYEQQVAHGFTGTVWVAVKGRTPGGLESAVVTAWVDVPVPGAVVTFERFLPLVAGVSSAGDGMPVTGRLRNLAGIEGNRQEARISWVHESAGTQGRVFVYSDGLLAADVAVGELGMAVPGLPGGDHSLQFEMGTAAEAAPRLMVDPMGRNAIYLWQRSGSADCIGYNIYDLTDGEELIAEIRDVAVEQLDRKTPVTGTGTGRLSAWGAVPDGTVVNGAGTITIVAQGEAEWSFEGGETTPFDFVTGSVIALPMGVMAAFHDGPEAYEIGDSYLVAIGPETTWISDVLAAGEHHFAVAAVDDAGNLSALTTGPGVYVVDLPDLIPGLDKTPGVRMTYNVTEGTMTVTYPLPEGALGVNVYTNFNPHTGLFEDYIVTDGLPFAQVAAPGASWTFDPNGAEGRLKFTLRPYNGACEREDGTLYDFGFPPEAADLGITLQTPTAVEAVPMAGGMWKLVWHYRREVEDDDLQAFEIWREGAAVAGFSASAGAANVAKRFEYVWSGAPETDGAEVALGVRASDGYGVFGAMAEVTLVADGAAPEAVTGVRGGAA